MKVLINGIEVNSEDITLRLDVGDIDDGGNGGGDNQDKPDPVPDPPEQEQPDEEEPGVITDIDFMNPPGSSVTFHLGRDELHVFPLKPVEKSYGAIFNAYTSNNPGSRVVWISETPGGSPIGKKQRAYESNKVSWIAGDEFSGYVPLTIGKKYYYNVKSVADEGQSYILNLKASEF